jgi:hypothetical protein
VALADRAGNNHTTGADRTVMGMIDSMTMSASITECSLPMVLPCRLSVRITTDLSRHGFAALNTGVPADQRLSQQDVEMLHSLGYQP